MLAGVCVIGEWLVSKSAKDTCSPRSKGALEQVEGREEGRKGGRRAE